MPISHSSFPFCALSILWIYFVHFIYCVFHLFPVNLESSLDILDINALPVLDIANIFKSIICWLCLWYHFTGIDSLGFDVVEAMAFLPYVLDFVVLFMKSYIISNYKEILYL